MASAALRWEKTKLPTVREYNRSKGDGQIILVCRRRPCSSGNWTKTGKLVRSTAHGMGPYESRAQAEQDIPVFRELLEFQLQGSDKAGLQGVGGTKRVAERPVGSSDDEQRKAARLGPTCLPGPHEPTTALAAPQLKRRLLSVAPAAASDKLVALRTEK